MNGHRGTVRKVCDAEPALGNRSVWESRCQTEMCGRYLTDDGWTDAMAHALSHYFGSIHGWVECTSRCYASLGWRA